MIKLFKWLLFFLLLLLPILFFSWGKYQSFIDTPIKAENQIINVQPGDNFNQLIEQLEKQKIISSALFMRIYIQLNHLQNSLKIGEYEINRQMTPVELVNLLCSANKTKQYAYTLVEGWTFQQMFDYLHLQPHLKAVNSIEEMMKSLGLDEKSKLEGSFFPETYFFSKNSLIIEVLKRSFQKMQQVLDEEWKNKKADLPYKNRYEALILASIVEKEAGNRQEMAKIAGVFIHRLNKGMRLQSDPTIIYGMGKNYRGNIRKKDILKKTSYNTYQIDGLPPTPIANPGIDAIRAVMNPDLAGNYLYFVANGKGGHQFSKTLVEHNREVKKYLNYLKSQH